MVPDNYPLGFSHLEFGIDGFLSGLGKAKYEERMSFSLVRTVAWGKTSIQSGE